MRRNLKYASVLLAMFLTIGSMPVSTHAATDDVEEITDGFVTNLDGKQKAVKDVKLSGLAGDDLAEVIKTHSDDDIVTVIVDVKEESAVEQFAEEIKDAEADGKTDPDGTNGAAKVLMDNATDVNHIDDKVEDISEKAEEAVEKDGETAETIQTYNTVFSGFSMNIPFGEINTIAKLKGVKGVYLAQEYTIQSEDEGASDEVNMVTSREMINTSLANESGYTGLGQVVAVLDTGIDYHHEAFNADKVDTAYTKVSFSAIRRKLDVLDLDAEKLYKDKTGKKLTSEKSGVENDTNIYHSDKVPYGFDYTDIDVNPIPVHSENHGTHVAGTIAGNSDKIQGVAPDAQLYSMKVFDDKGKTSDATLLAALDDAVLLGADVINMSLGSSAGISSEDNPVLNTAYDNVRIAGINLDVSAGNSGTAADRNNYGGYFKTSDPEYGIVGSPSTLPASLSVASVENDHMNYVNYITAIRSKAAVSTGENTDTDNDDEGSEASEGINISYIDTLSGDLAFSALPVRTYAAVNVGKGTLEETLAKADELKGGIALIERGGLTFSEKVKNATACGAVACVIYNNQPGTISMSLSEVTIPTVSITEEDGEKILAEANEKGIAVLKVNGKAETSFVSPTGFEISDFSSWGPTPELKIKPEIAMPGGNIYSAYYVENGESVYGLMSGTSMAAPHMAGASAVIRQALLEKKKGLTGIELEALVNELAMSTADPLVQKGSDETDVFYPVRQQGAGLVDLNEAVKSPVYLTVEGSERPKAELGDSADGTFSFTVTFNNMSSVKKVYPLETVVEAEGYADRAGMTVSSKSDIDITKGTTVTYSGETVNGNKVTVPGSGIATVTVNISLDYSDSVIADLASKYTNGFFVEGYFFANRGHELDYSVPFLGFAGDWSAAPIFDASYYDYKAYGTIPYFDDGSIVYNDVKGKSYYLGCNLFDRLIKGNKNTAYDINNIAISRSSLGKVSSVLATQSYSIRGSKNFEMKITGPDGSVVADKKVDYMNRAYYYSSAQIFIYNEALYYMPEFDGYDENGKKLPDGKYTFTMSATTFGSNPRTETKSFTFTLDNEKPVIDSDSEFFEEDGYLKYRMAVKDNDYLSGAEIDMLNKKTGKYDAVASVVFPRKKAGQAFNLRGKLASLDKLEAAGYDTSKVNVAVLDYAFNYNEAEIDVTTEMSFDVDDDLIGGGSKGSSAPSTPSNPSETPSDPSDTPSDPAETPSDPSETPSDPSETPAEPETPENPKDSSKTETPAEPATPGTSEGSGSSDAGTGSKGSGYASGSGSTAGSGSIGGGSATVISPSVPNPRTTPTIPVVPSLPNKTKSTTTGAGTSTAAAAGSGKTTASTTGTGKTVTVGEDKTPAGTANTAAATEDKTLYLVGGTTVNPIITGIKTTESAGFTFSTEGLQKNTKYKLVSATQYKKLLKKALANIKPAKTGYTLKKYGKATITLKKTASTASIKKITYKSLNTKVAKVNSKGIVTATGKGTAKVRLIVTLNNGSRKVMYSTVTVK